MYDWVCKSFLPSLFPYRVIEIAYSRRKPKVTLTPSELWLCSTHVGRLAPDAQPNQQRDKDLVYPLRPLWQD